MFRATAVSIVRKVGVVAVLVAGCHKPRACDALHQLAISPVRATDAEYMPGYPTEGVMSDASEFPSRGGIAHSQYYALRALREHGEPPLARLAGKGDAARCLCEPGLTRHTAVGRMLHTPAEVTHFVQNMDRCEKRPPSQPGTVEYSLGGPYLGRRHYRKTDEHPWTEVDRCLRESGFDRTQLGDELNFAVTDGDSWFLEAFRNGQYHAVLIHGSEHASGGALWPIDCCRLLLGYAKDSSHERWPPADNDVVW